MAKTLLELQWIEELLPDRSVRKPMFGGFAYYDGELLKLVMFEGDDENSYKGKTYPFEIWNGCMFPAEKDIHPQLLKKFPMLINHPVLPKWLYLPLSSENFEENVKVIIKDAWSPHSQWGTIAQRKKLKAKKKEKMMKITTKDLRTPHMFRDEALETKLHQIKTLKDFKNFGPTTEKVFKKAGIKTPEQFMKLGWKKAFQKLCEKNRKSNHSLFAYAIIGALENKMWNAISPEQKKEAQAFAKMLRNKTKK